MITRDSYGLLVTKNGDGGDSARNEWSYWQAKHLLKEMDEPDPKLPEVNTAKKTIELLEVKPGILVRNPAIGTWWNDPDRFSRDQSIGAIICGGIYDYHFLTRFWTRTVTRLFFAQNKTDTMIFHYGLWIRAFNWVSLYPILFLLDLLQIVTVFERAGYLPRWKHEQMKFVFGIDPDDVGDDWNLVMQLTQPGMETPTRRLMRWVYKKTRPKNLGSVFFKEENNILAALLWYNRNDNPELARMWAPIVRKYFG